MLLWRSMSGEPDMDGAPEPDGEGWREPTLSVRYLSVGSVQWVRGIKKSRVLIAPRAYISRPHPESRHSSLLTTRRRETVWVWCADGTGDTQEKLFPSSGMLRKRFGVCVIIAMPAVHTHTVPSPGDILTDNLTDILRGGF